MEHLQAYKDHCIDQAITILKSGHDIKCMFTTPKLLEALATKLDAQGTTIGKMGIKGIFGGGTEFTPQWTRFAFEEYLDGAFMTPTYGNTLMGLAASQPVGPHNGYKISYHAPQPRAVTQVVSFDNDWQVVDYGATGRVKLTTLTDEFFMPGFLERDEGNANAPTSSIHGTVSVVSDHSTNSRNQAPLAFTNQPTPEPLSEPMPVPQDPWRWHIVLIAMLVAACFSYSTTFSFINLDDHDYVLENPHVNSGLSLANVRWAFTEFHSANYHPLTWLSHQFDCHLFSLNPAGHHLHNVLLHLATSLLFYCFLRQWFEQPTIALIGALIWAIHPQRVEAIAWISERKSLLSNLAW